ncbi:MAG: peptidase S41 [Ignavibacteria bacterium RBG_13_36_8]|nr:MAG: peptidase S41 [Ignavibacteria bacterium RBG_13_36_8]
MKKIFMLFAAALLLSTTSVLPQDESVFIRYPAINNDGTKIAFSFQGDIWTMDLNGGQPVRLTVHEAHESFPKFSPDGKTIAFSSDRFGNNDIYVMPANGGIPKRLTYLSVNDNIGGWTNNGKILFETFRTYNQIEWESEIYQVSSDGGTPERLFDAFGSMPSASPDGRFIAYAHGYCRITREEYTGPANREIWLFDTKANTYSKLTTSTAQDIYPEWGDSRTLYYLNASSGRYNIHCIKIDENGNTISVPEQLTNYSDDGIRYFDISADGKTIVFERQTDIYLLNTGGGAPQKIKIQFGTDYRFDPYEHKTYSSDATEYAISPNGKYSALVIRGEIYVKENDKDKSKTVNLSNNPNRDQEPVWLNDSTLIFSSDRAGQYDLYMVRSADNKQTNLFKSLKHEVVKITDTDLDETSPIVSPNGKKIAYLKGKGGLIVADVSMDGKLSNAKVLLDGWDKPQGVAWSPDSKWLAYGLEDLNFNEEIYIHAVDNSGPPVNISMHPKTDNNPFWSADCSKLGFLSNRSNSSTDVWFVWLKKSDWQKTKQDWDEEDGESSEKKDKKDKDSTEVKPIVIDFENIHERITQVTSLPGNESDLVISNDGKTFYFVTNRVGNSNYNADNDLYSVKWDGTDMKSLTKGNTKPYAVDIDKEGKYLYFFKPTGKFSRIEAKSEKEEGLSYSAKFTINFLQERNQIFEEAWRTLRDGFYDPNFHGKNWNALKAKYKPWCMKASTYTDFREIFNYMLGELNASHMGIYGKDLAETQSETTGLLGADMSPTEEGMLVNRVIPNSPATKETSKLQAGDLIISVDGKPVNKKINFFSLLTNTVDEKVLLGIKDKAGKEREVVIRPVQSLNNELYDEWVKERRKLTDKYSNGRLGYLHIEAMGWESFERFERELTAAGYGKEGIVIDVRYNGGGWTTDYLMSVLNVKQHAYTIPRGAADDLAEEHLKFRNYYPFSERMPYYPWTKPSITLCNENSYSNAEIFSHAYKTLGIGKLVGIPTFGAVISTDGKGLINGWYVRLPFRAWYVKATDENMEWGPAVPDIVVENPQDYKTKEDLQLKTAIETLLKQIDNK